MMPSYHTDPKLTDEQLAMAVQQGDLESFGVLVERYEQKLLRYGRKFLSQYEDIQDIVQDIFINSYKNIQGFDPKQRFSPWIYRIAHNAFVNGIKKGIRNPLHIFDFDTLISHPVYNDPIEKDREQEEIKMMIEKGLDRLSSKYREVLILYFLQELSYREIADIIAVPLGTVGIRLARAKKELRKIYKDLNISYGK